MPVLGKNAYAVNNKLAGLAAAAFTPAVGPLDATRNYMNDGLLRAPYVFGANVNNALGIDFGAAVTLSGFAILNHNLLACSDGDIVNVTIRGADNAGMSINAVTVKAASSLRFDFLREQDHVLQFTSTTRRYWQIDFAWLAGGSHAMEIGELFAIETSDLRSLTRKSIYGAEDGGEILTLPNVFQYGERVDAYIAGPIKQKTYRYSDLTAGELQEFATMWATTGGPIRPLLWIESTEYGYAASVDPEQECMFAKVLRTAHLPVQDDYGIWQMPELVIRNLGRQVGK